MREDQDTRNSSKVFVSNAMNVKPKLKQFEINDVTRPSETMRMRHIERESYTRSLLMLHTRSFSLVRSSGAREAPRGDHRWPSSRVSHK